MSAPTPKTETRIHGSIETASASVAQANPKMAPSLPTKPVEPGPPWDVQVDLVSEGASESLMDEDDLLRTVVEGQITKKEWHEKNIERIKYEKKILGAKERPAKGETPREQAVNARNGNLADLHELSRLDHDQERHEKALEKHKAWEKGVIVSYRRDFSYPDGSRSPMRVYRGEYMGRKETSSPNDNLHVIKVSGQEFPGGYTYHTVHGDDLMPDDRSPQATTNTRFKTRVGREPHGESGHLSILVKDQDSEKTGYGKHNRIVVLGEPDGSMITAREDYRWGLPESTEAQRQTVLNGSARIHPLGTRLEYIGSEPHETPAGYSVWHNYRVVNSNRSAVHEHPDPHAQEKIPTASQSGRQDGENRWQGTEPRNEAG